MKPPPTSEFRLSKVRYLGENNSAALDPAIDKALNMAAQLDGQQGFSGA